MRRFMRFITTRNDNVDLVSFCEELNIFLKKYDLMGVLDEAINPIIIDEKNNNIGYG